MGKTLCSSTSCAAAEVLTTKNAQALILKHRAVLSTRALSFIIARDVLGDEAQAENVRAQMKKLPQPVRGRNMRVQAAAGTTRAKRARINQMTTHLKDFAQALERKSRGRGNLELLRVVALEAQEAIEVLVRGDSTAELLDLRSEQPPSQCTLQPSVLC